MDEKWKDKLIGYLILAIFGLFSFGVIKICESISDNAKQEIFLWQKKADKEDVNDEHAKLWKESDKLWKAIDELRKK